jgi:hypothetical protein
LASSGNEIRRLTSIATLIYIWSITVFYTIFQFGAVFIKINTWHGNLYILYQIVILFLYLCVALPVISISYRKNNS